MSKAALIVIDLQNDYFDGGAFPLWHAEETLSATLRAVHVARRRDIPVILVQHVADPKRGTAPFFNADTPGVACAGTAVLRSAKRVPHSALTIL